MHIKGLSIKNEIDIIKYKWQNNELILREELEDVLNIILKKIGLDKFSIEPLMSDEKVFITMSIFYLDKKFIYPEDQKEIKDFWKDDKPKTIFEKNIKIQSNKTLSKIQLQIILDVYLYYKISSPNLLNVSMELNLRDAIKIEESYSTSISETAENFKKYFDSKFQINSEVLTIDIVLNKFEKISNLDNTLLIQLNKLIDGIIKFQKPYFFKLDKKNYLIFPFCNDRNTILAKHILLFWSNKNFKRHILVNLNKSSNYYFNSFLPKQRLKQISDFQEIIIKLHSDKTKLLKGINFKDELNNSCKVLFKEIHNFSDISSVTFRMYNPFHNSMDLIFESSLLDRILKNDDKISFSRENESINIHVFKHCNIEESFYSRNIEEYKNIIKKGKKSLESFDRLGSKTELCFPVFFKKTKIGTINFESTSPYGFGKELNAIVSSSFGKIISNNEVKNSDIFNYCLTLRNLIQEYGEVLYENNDKFWLIERLQNYQNIHELKSLIRDKNLPKNSKQIIQNAIEVVNFNGSNETFDLKSRILEILDDYSLNMKNKLWRDKVSISDFTLNMDYHTKIYMDVLLKNLIKNFRDNSIPYIDYEKLFFAFDLKNKMLIFQMVFRFKNYSEQKQYYYLNRPYNVEKGSIYDQKIESHLGFFLIGVITRQLKGFCYLNEPKSQFDQKSILRIQIPMYDEK